MSVAVALLLAVAVATATLAAASSLRLRALDRVHAVSLTNLSGVAVTLAVWCVDGPGIRAAKATLVWIVVLIVGALGSHVVGRAIHLRDGRRR